MPFDFVLPILGSCFISAWVFIGGMLVRDSLDDARRLRFDTPSDSIPSRKGPVGKAS